MILNRFAILALLATVAGALTPSAFATVPFTEHFTSDAGNWRDAGGANSVNFVASGGIAGLGAPDGSYVTTTASAFFLDDEDPVVLFRGQVGFSSSGSAFTGNWLNSGINQFSTWVWHDAPVSLDFFVRFATAGNSPATAADRGILVAPNTWTRLTYEIAPSHINEYLFPEGPPSFFNSTFGTPGVGNIQVGYSVPAGFGLDHNSYDFALDMPSINTPEPASAFLAMSFAAIAFMRRRRTA